MVMVVKTTAKPTAIKTAIAMTNTLSRRSAGDKMGRTEDVSKEDVPKEDVSDVSEEEFCAEECAEESECCTGSSPKKYHFTRTESPDRLDRVIAEAVVILSRNRARRLIIEGLARINQRTVIDPAAVVKPGDHLCVEVPPPVSDHPVAQAMTLDILHEDEDVIVIDKPAGLVVHPAAGHPDHTLVNALLAHCGDSLSGIGGIRRPGIVHRLDKDTSGLMVVAKNDHAHIDLAEQFAARTITRAYNGLVWGVPQPSEGEINQAIGRHLRDRKKMAVRMTGGKAALTHYTTLKRYRSAGGGGILASLVECRLKTGRTHQIRVHLSHMGCPVIGDPVYDRPVTTVLPQSLVNLTAEHIQRQALHAVTLGFIHPTTKNNLRFCSDFPDDMKNLLRFLQSLC